MTAIPEQQNSPPLIITTTAAAAANANTTSLTSPKYLTATLSPPTDMLSPTRSSPSPSVSNKRPRPDDDDDDNDSDEREPGAPAHVLPSQNSPTHSTTPVHVPHLSVSTPTAKPSRHAAPTKKVLERNQACLDCRRRKRKCDGEKPACFSCAKLGRKCEYQANPVTKIHANNGPSLHRTAHSHSSPPARGGSSPSPSSHAISSSRIDTSPNPPASSASRKPGTVAHSAFTAVNANNDSPAVAAAARSSSHHLNAPNAHVTNGGYESSRSSKPPRKTVSPSAGGDAAADSFNARFFQTSAMFDMSPIDFTQLAAEPAFKAQVKDEEEQAPELGNDDLPNLELITELFELFFEKVHVLLPCLYQKQVMDDLASAGLLSRPNTLTYAILAIAGYLHPRPEIKRISEIWQIRAKEAFDDAVAQGKYTQLSVQGGIYICLRMFGLSQMHELWPFLGQVWRMCQPLGLNVLDNEAQFKRSWLPLARSEQENEERRRTMWAVYILDRVVSVSVPWSMNIIDDEFCVNFPASEEVFQSASMNTTTTITIDPFPISIDHLLPKRNPIHPSPDLDPYQYLCKLAVLIGRVTSLSRRFTPAPSSDFETLNHTITQFIIAIPRKTRQMQTPIAVLINILLCAARTWLYQPTIPPLAPLIDTPAFEQCTNGADGVIKALSNAVTLLDPADDCALANPFLGPPLWTAAKILATKYLHESAKGLATDARKSAEQLEILLSVFDRMAEVWPELAGKFRALVSADMKRDPSEVARFEY